MNRILLVLAALCVAGSSLTGQSNPVFYRDPLEVRFAQVTTPYHAEVQQLLREQPAWRAFLAQHGTWYVHFDEASRMPHRLYGKPVPVEGATPEERAMNFLAHHLNGFALPLGELVLSSVHRQGDHDWVNYRQVSGGRSVLGSRVVVKLRGSSVVMAGCDAYSLPALPDPQLTALEAETIATAGLPFAPEWMDHSGELAILPVPGPDGMAFHLVYPLTVHAKSDTGIPVAYYTLVDARTGAIRYRENRVRHICPHHPGDSTPPAASVQVNGQVYPTTPWNPAQTLGMANISITASGTEYFADENGLADLPVAPGTQAQVRLMGPWARVYSNGNTPSATFTVQSNSTVSMDAASNIRERSAYASMQRIHGHMKEWMPSFTGLDFQMATNIDVAGECNAFYNGSVNFYNIGGGCNASSLVADVVYHEYAHGINDYFYQSLGGTFVNGAMNEGYADFWALSLTNTPILGSGFYTGNLNPIRRYDTNLKVYPVDLVGQVHADGEIIMGAWWTTHQLLGADWNITMPLFVEAYPGMQAETFNGNEGQAYTDVLIDVLQADDDDGDITNGTPNGNAIVQGFYQHGITLLSNAELSHTDVQFAEAGEEVLLQAALTLQFPFTQYLQDVECHYRVNDGGWQVAPLEPLGGNFFALDLEAQEPGTVISYYLATRDVNGFMSNVQPAGADLPPFPTLPYFILVGVEVAGVHDCDENENWGSWQTGLGSDLATTGEWELEVPVGSQTTDVNPGTVVQPSNQITPGGEYCFVTGNASSTSSPIGENDVDGGQTTLQSALIDMSSYNNPVVSYWRWYTNSPPGGANPGADYWQVRMSNNGGQTWVDIENTLTTDMRWRRNAFRVSDYLEPTAQMRFRFIASDSIRPGQNLEGGSLVEAALDDFVVYEAEEGLSVDESAFGEGELAVWPNPVSGGEMEVSFAFPRSGPVTVRILSAAGQVVMEHPLGQVPSGPARRRIPLPPLAAGAYLVEVRGSATATRRVVVE